MFQKEWLESPQYVHFVLAEFAFSLCLLDPELLLSRFKYSVCNDECSSIFDQDTFPLFLILPGG